MTTLLFNFIFLLFVSLLLEGPLKDPMGLGWPQSKKVIADAQLPRLMKGLRLHWGFVLALLAAAGMHVFMFRLFRGYQLQVGGLAPAAARYAGFSSRKTLWSSLLICGALSGLAGACEVLGPMGQLTPTVSPGYGFAAIIVAFVGRLHPVGVLFSSFVMALFYIGGELAQSRLGLPSAITGVFQGILLFALLACDVLIQYKLRWRKHG